MKPEDLIKELQNLKYDSTVWTYYCFDGGKVLTAVHYVEPNKDGCIACPKKECKEAARLKCSHLIKGVKREDTDAGIFNKAIDKAISAIEVRFSIRSK